ncbi:benzoyl-CoA 2,3-epoxidase subunit BoxA [Saccharospirillum sp.]|uniref:benzoyl-CoA 2,3-epoxidase subunit BoxA n=1 Tax=Saccharospirillum sp. TaxID=2033801 RepID=UPI0034A058D4
MTVLRQHLIDPEICIRCNTCEETCPIDAITHNDDNYVVNADLCNYCMDCIAPCPTGSIDNWRMVNAAYSIDEQFEWDELPEELELDDETSNSGGEADNEAEDLLHQAHSGARAVPPFSAAHPYINLYSRDDPIIAKVAGNFRITGADTDSDIRHIILDFGSTAFPVLEGQSIGILPPGQTASGKAHTMRLYSIASPRDGERQNHNNVSLTVKRVDGGVASNYLCDLQKGDEVKVIGPFGDSFLMPNHPEANIIMICTGTGSAPFRAFTERRRRKYQDADGKLMLFFGARTPTELPYFGPLNKLPDSLIQKELVFSRQAGKPKEYVQDRMRKSAENIAPLLQDENTFIFVCGLKGMEQGVEEALNDIAASQKVDWAALRNDMLANGRYHVETY